MNSQYLIPLYFQTVFSLGKFFSFAFAKQYFWMLIIKKPVNL